MTNQKLHSIVFAYLLVYKASLGHKLLYNNLQTSIYKFAMTPCYDSTTKTPKRGYYAIFQNYCGTQDRNFKVSKRLLASVKPTPSQRKWLDAFLLGFFLKWRSIASIPKPKLYTSWYEYFHAWEYANSKSKKLYYL